MNIFKGIRLSIWSILLASCITISGVYVATMQTFLSTEGLTKVVTQSKLADTVRNEVLLPKILQTTRGSDYATLLDDKTVMSAFDEAVSTETLNRKLEPAAASLQKWLNSQEPAVAFSIDMTDVSRSFASKLAQKVNDKYSELTPCTPRNTIADAETGICRSSLVTEASLSNKIKELVNQDASLQQNSTLTPESIGLTSALAQAGNDAPTYLNMFYAAAIITAGIALLVTLWLLLKHRLSGIIAIGFGVLLSSAALYVAAIIGTQTVKTLTYDPQLIQIVRAGIQALQNVLQQEALLLAGIGIVLVIIGAIAKIIRSRHARPKQSLHLTNS